MSKQTNLNVFVPNMGVSERGGRERGESELLGLRGKV